MKKDRIDWLDSLKGFGILLVILGHTQFPYKDYLYWFHMPLFFILSGYTLHLTYSCKVFIIKKINSFIIPYFIFGVLLIFMTYFANPKAALLEFLKLFYGGIKNGGTLGTLWFLPTLCLAEMLLYILNKNYLLKKYVIILILPLLFISLNVTTQLPFNLNIIPLVVIYLLFGIYFKTFYELNSHLKELVCLCIFVISLVLAFKYQFQMDLKYDKVTNLYFAIILPVCMTTILIFSFQRIRFLKINSILNYLGKNSLTIMLVHNYFRIFLENQTNFSWFVVFLLTTILTVVSVELINLDKINKYLTPQIPIKK